MDIPSYRESLENALTQLSAYDKDSFLGLWNFLYDWGNHLLPCAGKVKSVLLKGDLDESSKILLESVERTLNILTEDLKGAVIDYTQHTSEKGSTTGNRG